MTSRFRSLLDAYADAVDAHEVSCVDYGAAVVRHDGPRKRRDATHRAALESARARYRQTSDGLRAARGAILAALESDR
jgi:hypothetical protein